MKYPLQYEPMARSFLTGAIAAEIASSLGINADDEDVDERVIAFLKKSIAEDKPSSKANHAHEKVLSMVDGIVYGIALASRSPMFGQAVLDEISRVLPDYASGKDTDEIMVATKQMIDMIDGSSGGQA